MALIYNRKQEGVRGTHVFIVGVGEYPSFPSHTPARPVGQIDSAANGALEIVKWVTAKLLNNDAPLQTVRLLLSGQQQAAAAAQLYGQPIQPATYQNVSAEYAEWMADLTSEEGNIAVFYFAGHGFGNEEMQCLLLEDYNRNKFNALDGSFNYNNLVHSVRVAKKVSHAWFFVDACREATIVDLARGDWGRELNGNVTRLAGGISCAQVFSAAAGEGALGEEGQTSFFSRALIEALDNNGYTTGHNGDWVVQIHSLQHAVVVNMKRICLAAGIPEAEIPRVTQSNPDPFPVLHQRSADDFPKFLVKVTCVPASDNNRYVLACTCVSSDVVTSRQPDDNPWYFNLPPGQYRFEALDGDQTAMQRTEHIYMYYREIELKGEV